VKVHTISETSGSVKKKMIRLEKENASSLSASVEKLGNVVVKELLRSVAYDSQKHAASTQPS